MKKKNYLNSLMKNLLIILENGEFKILKIKKKNFRNLLRKIIDRHLKYMNGYHKDRHPDYIFDRNYNISKVNKCGCKWTEIVVSYDYEFKDESERDECTVKTKHFCTICKGHSPEYPN